MTETERPQLVRRSRALGNALVLAVTGVAVVVAGVTARQLGVPSRYVSWSELGTGGLLVLVLVFWMLLGPVARWMAGEGRAIAPHERVSLSVKDRLDAVNAARQTLMQSATGAVVIAGVVFTAAGLVYTARTLHTTEQGQITDRYTKAVEQLGSDKLDIRLGGTYALERIATDSPRDDRTVYDVLTAFVREHDPEPGAKTPDHPATDIQAAMTVVGRRKPLSDGFKADLDHIRVHGADLSHANLTGADLTGADLTGADLTGADLTGAHLSRANLTGADLTGAKLSHADLTQVLLMRANLSHIQSTPSAADVLSEHVTGPDLRPADFTGANLTSADLTDADLSGARLNSAEMFRANLLDVNLFGVELPRADLRSAKLVSANLQFANLTSANLSHAKLSFADLTRAGLNAAKLPHADLSYAKMMRIGLFHADLTRANLGSADLSYANLVGANLAGADMTAARIRGADLRDANLVDVQFLDSQFRQEARTDSSTTF